MKRPRKYFDRRWLEGYTVTAERVRTLAWSGALGRAEVARRFWAIIRQPKLTAYECGCVDALLDSVGC